MLTPNGLALEVVERQTTRLPLAVELLSEPFVGVVVWPDTLTHADEAGRTKFWLGTLVSLTAK